MASNDGRRLSIFGLSFRQHDNRHMQTILRSYGKLPDNPGNRTALYTGLFALAKGLPEDEVQGIADWLKEGGHGEFPVPAAASEWTFGRGEGRAPGPAEGEWPEYDPVESAQAGSDTSTGIDDGSIDSAEPAVYDEITIIDSINEANPKDDDESSGSDGEFEDAREELWTEEPIEHALMSSPPSSQHVTPPADPVLEVFSSGIECNICAESFEASEFPVSKRITESCDHDHDYMACLECLERQIHSALQAGALNQLRCPFCPEELSYAEVKKYASKETFARYEYLRLLDRPDIIMCLGPNCGSGQIHEGNDSMMTCNTCQYKICVVHKLPWHDGMTCDEFDTDESQIERLEQAEATAKLLSKDQSKICPNCKQGVTKQDGCDHLMCRCGQEWCFVCLASWENIIRIGQEAHAPTCTYHPRKVQMRVNQKVAAQTQMTETVIGGPVSEALLRAREARNERIRVDVRVNALQAAEQRMKQRSSNLHIDNTAPKKRRLKLAAPWEER